MLSKKATFKVQRPKKRDVGFGEQMSSKWTMSWYENQNPKRPENLVGQEAC